MISIAEDMKGGLTEYFKGQASIPGKVLVDYAQFDTVYELVYQDKPIADASVGLRPRGGTALLDAIGKTVVTLGEKLAAQSEDERPDKVLVIIITDGHENSSREWNKDAVKKLVAQQTDDYNWQFVFLGANMDAVDVAGGLGISTDSSLTYSANSVGTAGVMASLNTFTKTYRGKGKASFTDDDRQKATS